ncbi:amidase family protein [Marinomonas ostreistagni]|uniref:amidase family protein n=1 Tax=Marinomonas ostreistagni TaxID=359209 RepID=UPI001950C8E8|nr:amidase family protein [Marinomonas ostreistagni]MBM6550413.1 amidase [Marinomonas ostreistagni]
MTAIPTWQTRDWQTHWHSVQDRLAQAQDSVFIERFEVVQAPQESSAAPRPLEGAIASIKANFDVKGQRTSAGSLLLGQEPATQSAEAVARLQQAGASLLGHTNMTELAYSGVGLNPHFGTPANPSLPDAIPGGSTSGGAVTVAQGMADIALGTDTGGSLRIPAAFCGITGFKPSRNSTPQQGCMPLSQTLDSVGVITKSVADCQVAWQVLAQDSAAQDVPLESVQWLVPENFGFDDADASVVAQFNAAIDQLKAAGVALEQRALPELEQYKEIPVWQFSAVESRRYYGEKFDLSSSKLDPRVRKRIERGAEVSDEAFSNTETQRHNLIARLREAYSNSVFVLPTVACLPPKMTDFESDEAFDRINLLCLRNTTFANVIDGCSISLPLANAKQPVGLMLTMQSGQDARLLSLAAQVERLIGGAQ